MAGRSKRVGACSDLAGCECCTLRHAVMDTTVTASTCMAHAALWL
jgi:hypothetical protein